MCGGELLGYGARFPANHGSLDVCNDPGVLSSDFNVVFFCEDEQVRSSNILVGGLDPRWVSTPITE